jgi:flagellar biosynthetic protein FliO
LDTDFNMLSFKLAIFLLVIFALMILFFFIIKRMKGGSFSMGKYPVIRNVATLPLAPKKSLTLVEVCDQWLLVGVGTENISLISRIDKPSDASQPESNIPQEGNIFDSFLLKAGLKHRSPDGSSKTNE